MDLYFLGTGAGLPSTTRNVSAIALRLLSERGRFWLFDCGEGTQQQILTAPIRLSRLEKVFITHLHGDHIFGLPGLLGSRSFQGAKDTLHLYGPQGLARYVQTCLQVSQTHLTYPVEVHEFPSEKISEEPSSLSQGKMTPFTVWEDGQFQVQAAPLEHRIPCYGYRIAEREKPGHLDPVRLNALGLSPGPVYGALQRGETVTLPDGHILRPTEFRCAPRPGRVITILGDTRPCSGSLSLAQHANVLVHEATFAAADQERAAAYTHSTAREAAEVAKQAKVGRLVLTHISNRYQETGTTQLLADAKEIFPDTYLAADGWNMTIQ